jgi:RsmE family RNA methyltransferase
MNRILFEKHEIGAAGTVVCADQRAEHIRKVLRAWTGQTVRVGLLDGPCGEALIEALAADAVRLRCHFAASLPALPPTDLLLALPRPKVMKRLWAPLAALGVGRIAIVKAAKVERNYFATHWLQPEYYRPLLIEGLQQAGDTRLPQVTVHRRFRPLIEDRLAELFAGCARIVADPAAECRFADLALSTGQRALLAVGPEGGWTPFELDLLQANGFKAVRAGERILRADTACIALLALLQERLG